MNNAADTLDLADLIGTPERVADVPAEMIPSLIGVVELQEAGLERLKAELWARLLRDNAGKNGSRVSSSPPSDAFEGGTRSKQSRTARSTERGSGPADGSPTPRRTLMSVRQFCAAHPGFTQGSLRWLLFKREANGLAVALVKKGRRIWIDADAFFEWLERSEPAAHSDAR